MKRCGPCRSTPPRMSAALTWPWYLPQHSTAQRSSTRSKAQHMSIALVLHCKQSCKRCLRLPVSPHLNRWLLSSVMAVATRVLRPVPYLCSSRLDDTMAGGRAHAGTDRQQCRCTRACQHTMSTHMQETATLPAVAGGACQPAAAAHLSHSLCLLLCLLRSSRCLVRCSGSSHSSCQPQWCRPWSACRPPARHHPAQRHPTRQVSTVRCTLTMHVHDINSLRSGAPPPHTHAL